MSGLHGVDKVRRRLMLGCGAVMAASWLSPASSSDNRAQVVGAENPPNVRDIALRAGQAQIGLLGERGPLSDCWVYNNELFPIFRARKGERLRVTFKNALPEHTSIHWHGLRIPSDADGVPYISQAPVQPGERFLYEFAPPDAGTFFFHPHCNETGQTGRGLMGLLLVEGDTRGTPAADGDGLAGEHVLAMKDWRVREDGRFLDFKTVEGASRSGTFGTVRSVNGKPVERLTAPAHSDLRLRVLALDPTRVFDIGIEGAEAAVIAIDGHPTSPFPLKSWLLGPAQRIDLAVRMPKPGKIARVMDFRPSTPHEIATLAAVKSERSRARFAPRALEPASVPQPDLRNAQRMTFRLQAAADGAAMIAKSGSVEDPLTKALLDSLCAPGRSLWAINRQFWASEDNRQLPPPLAVLEAGRSYVWEIVNTSQHMHPMHLHGHAFTVLKSPAGEMRRYLADTVLLGPRERAEIAFVAAPGAWMFHCHLLEHQETGMMGWIRVA